MRKYEIIVTNLGLVDQVTSESKKDNTKILIQYGRPFLFDISMCFNKKIRIWLGGGCQDTPASIRVPRDHKITSK